MKNFRWRIWRIFSSLIVNRGIIFLLRGTAWVGFYDWLGLFVLNFHKYTIKKCIVYLILGCHGVPEVVILDESVWNLNFKTSEYRNINNFTKLEENRLKLLLGHLPRKISHVQNIILCLCFTLISSREMMDNVRLTPLQLRPILVVHNLIFI